MAINIQKLLEAIQTSIGNATPATPTRELEILTKGAFKWGDNQITSFDSDGEFLDSVTTSPFMLAYHTGKNNIYAFDSDRTWKSISGTVSPVFVNGRGSTSGYASGGFAPGTVNVINKYPFSSDANATDVGDLTLARNYVSGQSSDVSGYTSGGFEPTNSPTPTRWLNTIDKFPFSSDGNATDVGNLPANAGTRYATAGQSSMTHGYVSGGIRVLPSGSPVVSNLNQKFSFASDGDATTVGNLSNTSPPTNGSGLVAGQSSENDGYVSGGQTLPGANQNKIDKFPFSSDANASDVGDLTVARKGMAGSSSDVSGYNSGGIPTTNVIDKFPFASDGNATDVGDLLSNRYYMAGQSSTANGYTSGGLVPPNTNAIEKFPFSSDANSTDVGDLTGNYYGNAGQQV